MKVFLPLLALIGSIALIRAQNATIPLSIFPIGVCAYNVSDFEGISKLGIKWVRMDHPKTATIELARSYGIEVLPIQAYGYTDLSESTDYKRPPLPQHRTAWSLRRLADLKNLTQPPKVLEVWNEPFHRGFWPPNPNATDYLGLVKDFATEAWKLWPNVTILVSADTDAYTTDGVTPTFRRDLLAADTEKFLTDPRILPTTHNYAEARTPTQVTGSPCRWDVNRFQCTYDDFKKHGHDDPRVWVTEFGWESRSPNSYSSFGNVTEANQTRYIVESIDMFRNSGKVASAFIFMYNSNDKWSYNLIYANGTYKPAALGVRDYIIANTPEPTSEHSSVSSSSTSPNTSPLNPSSPNSSGTTIFTTTNLMICLFSLIF